MIYFYMTYLNYSYIFSNKLTFFLINLFSVSLLYLVSKYFNLISPCFLFDCFRLALYAIINS